MEVVGRILDASRNHMQKGFTALHLAVQNGLDRLVQQLLVLPSTAVDARDADGLTALHWAAAEGEAPPPSNSELVEVRLIGAVVEDDRKERKTLNPRDALFS